MIRFDDLGLFARSAVLGSFSKAARETGLLPGQVSAAIQRLERELDIRLFARSTRSLHLTDEGQRYLSYVQDALDTLREGREGLRRDDAALSGTLQVAAPSDLGRNVLLPWLSEFRRTHPRLDLRLLLCDQVTNLFRDPVDIAIRYGGNDATRFVALPLAPDNRRVLVAGPAYLERHGNPQSPAALAEHHCLLLQLQGRIYDKWLFPIQSSIQNGAETGKHFLQVSGSLVTDDADVVRLWALAGEGIAYKSWLDVCHDVRAGRLQVVLPQQPGEHLPLQLICPHRRQFSAAVRQLFGLIRMRCAALNSTETKSRQNLDEGEQ